MKIKKRFENLIFLQALKTFAAAPMQKAKITTKIEHLLVALIVAIQGRVFMSLYLFVVMIFDVLA